MITGKNFIGEKRSAKGNTDYKTFNPLLNMENEYIFVEATSEEIEEAVALADSAFKTYSNVPGKEKAKFLIAIAEELQNMESDLVSVYCKETGLPEGRAKGELGRTTGQLRTFANLLNDGSWVEATIETGDPDRTPAPKPDIRKLLVPLGPVVVFGASNFPFAFSTAGGDTASALAAGCPVLVKSHPLHAGTSELVASAIIQAAQKTGMPSGVFSHLNSSGIDVGRILVSHPKVKAVGFTGSFKAGKALLDLAATREEPIPVFAEMGSINPVLLLPNALDNEGSEIAKLFAGSITLGSGQFCTNPGLLLGIEGDSLSNFINTLSTEIAGIQPSCMLHPNILKNFKNKKQEISSQSGTAVVQEHALDVQGNFSQQMIVRVKATTFLENAALHQEVFGPFSMVVECRDMDEMIEVIRKLEGQLTGTIMAGAEELSEYGEIIEALKNKVGRLIYNGAPTGVEVSSAMQHGGPFPATTDNRFTSVGTDAIKRWVRPVSFQNWPNKLLPEELKDENPLKILRMLNNKQTNTSI